MIDRYLLRYFLAVVDQGNFSKAAVVCNVSQPTLSVGIGKLEKSLGQVLFRRTNRRVELTEAGATLSGYARRIEAEFATAERAVGGAGRAAALRLGVMTTIPAAWIASFLERHAGSGGGRVEIVEARPRDLTDRLGRGRIDLALTIVDRNTDKFDGDRLFSEGYALAVPASHRLADRDGIGAEDLVNDAMIVRRHCELLAETSRHFTARGVRPFFAARTTSDDRALAYIEAGLGVTVMPDCFGARRVRRVRLRDFPFTRDVGLLYAPHVDARRYRAEPAVTTLAAVLEESYS